MTPLNNNDDLNLPPPEETEVDMFGTAHGSRRRSEQQTGKEV